MDPKTRFGIVPKGTPPEASFLWSEAFNEIGIVLKAFLDRNEEAWLEVFIEDKHSGPAAVATMKMDFTEWLKSLPYRVRRIAKLLATGEKTTIVAEKFNLSAGRISQLRRELAQSWKKFQGEADSTAA